MSLEPVPRSTSPDSSGRDSPIPRQWRNQFGNHDPPPVKDKHFRKYASGVDRALALFETALQEWADYISFLNRLLKALQARHPTITKIPAKATVAKRLAQCLNPSLPSGVHQKTLEVYGYIFSVIGRDGLSRDLPLYLPGLAAVLSFASLSVRSPFLKLVERHFLDLDPRALRPATKSIVLALLPGLEEETSDDFERTLRLLDRFKVAIRPPGSSDITPAHSSGDDFFWQCFFLASITGHGRRTGALAYLVRQLPRLGHATTSRDNNNNTSSNNNNNNNSNDNNTTPKGNSDAANEDLGPDAAAQLVMLVTTPEPGLLLRCFAAGLGDEQILIQRGFLDLLVTHLPLHSTVLQKRVKGSDLELLLRAAVGVTVRRDMSLNRRLWTWLLGPETSAPHEGENGLDSPTSISSHGQTGFFNSSRTSYFQEHGLQALTRALLSMIRSSEENGPAERARPCRICLSLMDRWEIGGLVVPEVFLPLVDSVRAFKANAASKGDFAEVLRSASVFFDGVESGLIYSEILSLVAHAVSPGPLAPADRCDKLDLVQFILANFNVREEEMVTIHAPLAVLSVLCMLEEAKTTLPADSPIWPQTLDITASLLEIVPGRAFPAERGGAVKHGKQAMSSHALNSKLLAETRNVDLLKKIKSFYVTDQGSLDPTAPPFAPQNVVELLLQKASALNCESLGPRLNSQAASPSATNSISIKGRILIVLLTKAPEHSPFDVETLLSALHQCLARPAPIPFVTFFSALDIATHLRSTGRISHVDLTELVAPLVRHAWTFLSASAPKYHVETARSLWLLQTALGGANRDIEAAICALMLEGDAAGTFAMRPAGPGRRFGVLWSQSLQDNPHGMERRGSGFKMMMAAKSGETTKAVGGRLGGMDHYEVMLSRPLFLMLDALNDERTQLFMTVKTWLNSLIGTEKLFKIFVTKFAELPYLRRKPASSNEFDVSSKSRVQFCGDDDLDLGIYYLRALSNVFRWASDNIWAVLAKRTVPVDLNGVSLSEITGTEKDVTMQEFFLHMCLRCIAGDKSSGDRAFQVRLTQLYRSSLTVLHQILLNPYSESLAALHLETLLIERLVQSLSGSDPYVQVLLLDVVFASLKFGEALAAEAPPPSPKTGKRTPSMNMDPKSSRGSLVSVGEKTHHTASAAARTLPYTPPPALIKCIQAGLSSPSSRAVLDSWVSFLGECLPLYSDSIFQVLIPLVETLCSQIASTFSSLRLLFMNGSGQLSPVPLSSYSDEGEGWGGDAGGPENTLISLLNGLEQVLAKGHDRLLAEETRAQVVKSPDQPQGFFGSVVSGVFSSDAMMPQSRSATANDRLTVLLAFQDAVRICFTIWSWGHGRDNDSSSICSIDSQATTMAGAKAQQQQQQQQQRQQRQQQHQSQQQDPASVASFTYTSLRMRNRARRLLEHLFAAEMLECLETVIGIWRSALDGVSSFSSSSGSSSSVAAAAAAATAAATAEEVLNLLPALDGSRPKHTIPALFNALYSRTNPQALEPSRRSTLTVPLQDTDVVVFLVDYARSLEDDAMDEIWQDCTAFLRDLLANPFPHRQTLPNLLEFAAILGEKVDNTNFGEQRKMRRDLADLFLRLLTAIFTTRPINFADTGTSASSGSGNYASSEKRPSEQSRHSRAASFSSSPSSTVTVSLSGGRAPPLPPPPLPVQVIRLPGERAEDVVGILAGIVPNLPKILVDNDRILTAATAISANVIGPTLRARAFPDTVSRTTLVLLQELSRLPNNLKAWKKDVADAFNDSRFFDGGGSSSSSNSNSNNNNNSTSHNNSPDRMLSLVRDGWLPLLRSWTLTDKERLPELLARIAPPATAGLVFGVGATSARLEADRKTQLNLRRVAVLVLAGRADAFAADLPAVLDKVVELLGATATSSPSSATRAEVYMVLRALVLRVGAVHLAGAGLWPVVSAELHAAVASVVAPDHSPTSDMYGNAALMQACKLLDLLVCVAPDDFQLAEWLFVTDTVDAVYLPAAPDYAPVALVDELAEELGGEPLPIGGGGSGGGAGPHVGSISSIGHDAAAAPAPGAAATARRGPGSIDASSPSSTSTTTRTTATSTTRTTTTTTTTTTATGPAPPTTSPTPSPLPSGRRRPLLGFPGGISDDVSMERKDELVGKVLRPFFGQLSIFAFESTYAMAPLDLEWCVQGLLRDLFDERTIVRAL